MPRLRARITYANVMATIAVFVAIGGSAAAALVITGKNVKNGSLSGIDIKNGSLKSVDIKNGGLRPEDFPAGRLPKGPKGDPGPPGDPGAPGKDATPADFAGEPTNAVAPAPGDPNQCSTPAVFCTGSNGWAWRNYGNGYQAVGFWKDRGGVTHLEGAAELFGGAAGGQPPAFVLPDGYRPTALRRFTIGVATNTTSNATQVLRFVDVYPDGRVRPDLDGAGIAWLDGISFRP